MNVALINPDDHGSTQDTFHALTTTEQSQVSHSNPAFSEAEVSTIFDPIITRIVALSNQAREFEDYKARMVRVERELEALSMDNATLRQEIDEVRHERDRARQEAEEFEALATSYSRERDEWRSKANDFETKWGDATANVDHLLGANNDLGNQLSDVRRQLMTMTSDRDAFGNDVERLGCQLGDTRTQLARQAETILAQRDQLGDLSTRLGVAEDDLDRAKAKLVEADAKLGQLNWTIEVVTHDRDTLREKLSRIRNEASQDQAA